MLSEMDIPLPISERVADAIRNAILDGQLSPGQRVSVREVSDALKVSTTPVKEAFKILKAEGLVISHPRSGTLISDFSRQNMKSTAFVRSALEGVAANLAAQLITDEEIQRLEEIIAEVDECVGQGRIDRIGVLNTTFHGLINSAARSSYLRHQTEVLRSFDITFRRFALKETTEMQNGIEEHKKILDALRKRDGDLAESLTVQHIRRSALHVLAMQEEPIHEST